VVELVDAPDSKSGSERSVGSIPTGGTTPIFRPLLKAKKKRNHRAKLHALRGLLFLWLVRSASDRCTGRSPPSPANKTCDRSLDEQPASHAADFRNSLGERPITRLNAALKALSDS
jgi:hypothetical protein